MGNSVPVLAVVSAVDVEQQKRDEAAKKEASLAGPAASNLITYLNKCKDEAIHAKQMSGVTDKLLDAQRRREGKHSPEKLAQLQKYGLPVYWVPVTQTKCIHTEAWMRDLLMPYADKIWRLDPTVLPELQDDDRERIFASVMDEALAVMSGGEMVTDDQIEKVEAKATEIYKKALDEDAKDKATNMEMLIQDQQEECDFRSAFREFQANMTTYGTAFLKGPFTVQRKSPRWKGKDRVVENKVIPACSAPSPHDIFPAPWAKNEQDGYIIERIKTYREGLSSIRKLPHYQTTEIEALLAENKNPSSSTQPGDTERAASENKGPTPNDDRIELWQFSGPVPGYMLKEWGITGCDASEEYEMEVLWSGTHIVKVVPQWDEVGVRPYFRGVFKAVVGSFWGIGVPHLMSASQDRANTIMIATIYNVNWGAAPSGWIDLLSCVNPDDAREMHPGKFTAVQIRPGTTSDPIGFNQVPMHVSELSKLYQSALNDADNESGVPAYMYGSGSQSPAGGTYAGLSTLMNAAARGIKDALLEVDMVMSRLIQHWADWNNEYSDDESVKGDVRVVCSGATGLFVQEMQLDRMDAMVNQAVSLMPITGLRFCMNILRQKAKILKIDTKGLPTDEELKAQENAPKDPQPVPLKPSLSISAKWPELTDAEKVALMHQTGVEEPVQQIQQQSSTQSPGAPAKSIPVQGASQGQKQVVAPVTA